MCRVGLGVFGVVAEYTLKCIPSHRLLEHTTVLTRAEAVEQLPSLLKGHKHMRYMWIPYEDAVVVVTNDPFDASVDPLPQAPLSPKDPLAPFRDLLKSHPNKVQTLDQIDGMGMGELRDSLLDLDPLSTEWVKKVNAAEHKFWKNACGYRYLPSDQLLQFECGGQQHVQEVCFPTGSLYNPSNADMDFMTRLLAKIEQGERERSITRRIKLNKCSFLQALSFISPPPLRSSQTPSPPPLQ